VPLTDEGYTARRTSDYLTIVRDALEAELASRGVTGTPDYERDAFLGGVTAVIASLFGDLDEATQAVYDARDPNNATGVQLSTLSLGVGVTRNEATPSAVVITMAGTAGTVIPAGRTIRGGDIDGEALWDLTADATIGGGGTVDGTFEAQEPGARLAPAATTWEIVTPIFGWDTATNAADAAPGQNRETDDELRVRRAQSLQISGSASAAALRAALLEIDEVAAAGVIENDDAPAATIEGVLVAANGVAVVLHPGTLTGDPLTEAIQTIYDNVSAGIETSGALSATVVGEDLIDKTVRYSFAASVGVTATIVVEMEPASTTNPSPPTFAEAEPDIEAAIDAYEAALSIGDDVRALPLLSAIDGVTGVRSASVVLTVPLDPSKVQVTGDVSILLSEIAVITTAISEA
jgi:uncharacterized phage protein gp47/JayE